MKKATSTDTSLHSRRLVLVEQLRSPPSTDGQARSHRGLTVDALCRQLGHPATAVRGGAIVDLAQLLVASPDLVAGNLHVLVPAVGRLLSDPVSRSSPTRTTSSSARQERPCPTASVVPRALQCPFPQHVAALPAAARARAARAQPSHAGRAHSRSGHSRRGHVAISRALESESRSLPGLSHAPGQSEATGSQATLARDCHLSRRLRAITADESRTALHDLDQLRTSFSFDTMLIDARGQSLQFARFHVEHPTE